MIKKYNKISAPDVFNFMCQVLSDVMCPVNTVSVPMIAKYFDTSKYRVRKAIKILKEQGLVKNTSVWPTEDDEQTLPWNGFGITSKGLEHRSYKYFSKKSEDLFKKAFYEEA